MPRIENYIKTNKSMKKMNQILVAVACTMLACNSYGGVGLSIKSEVAYNSVMKKGWIPLTVVVMDSKGTPIPGVKVGLVDSGDEPVFTDEKGMAMIYFDPDKQNPYFFVSTSAGYTSTQVLNLDGTNVVICNQ